MANGTKTFEIDGITYISAAETVLRLLQAPHLTGEETDRVIEILAAGENRPAYGEDWTEYLDARAQALVYEVATGYDEDEEPAEPVLTAVETDGTWAVDDAAGGRWFPGDDAETEIDASDDPAATAVRLCREQPMRGDWRY